MTAPTVQLPAKYTTKIPLYKNTMGQEYPAVPPKLTPSVRFE